MLRAPFTDDRLQEAEQEAAVMGAVLVRADASTAEGKEAEERAQACWERAGRVAAWGCQWYQEWFDKVSEAVSRNQKLKAVFFPGQLGLGKVSMPELSHEMVNLWDGIGLGGSQKCEIATADDTGLSSGHFIQIIIKRIMNGLYTQRAQYGLIKEYTLNHVLRSRHHLRYIP